MALPLADTFTSVIGITISWYIHLCDWLFNELIHSPLGFAQPHADTFTCVIGYTIGWCIHLCDWLYQLMIHSPLICPTTGWYIHFCISSYTSWYIHFCISSYTSWYIHFCISSYTSWYILLCDWLYYWLIHSFLWFLWLARPSADTLTSVSVIIYVFKFV